MQALNLMISDKSKVYYCIDMDRKTVSAGIAAKHGMILKYLANDGLEHGFEYGNKFIEKFIQLPFKVPIPKKEDLKELLNPQQEKKRTDNSKENRKDKEEHDCEERSENNELSEDFKKILEIVAPALDSNPRRMKQFFNLFRFQRTFGFKTGLFSDKMGPSSEYWWNCKKVAKFVAISIKWPSLIAALDSDMTLLGQLQDYAIGPEKQEAEKTKKEEENKLKEKQEKKGKLEEKEKTKKEEEKELEEEEKTKKGKIKKLEKLINEKKLIELLREGCVEGGKLSEDYTKYTLSGLDFNKLLEISPEFTSSDSLSKTIKSIEFVRIPAGEFLMGSPSNEQGRWNAEGPVHKVSIKKSFCLSKYPVTQKQWIAVMGYNPSYFKGEERPVENVSWDDAQEFIRKLNQIEEKDNHRLPSEAEWEYACRTGKTTRYSFGDDESKLGDYAWYYKNSGSETHPVGLKKPNAWGLYDMHGNVWEWCQDMWYENYKGSPSDGKAWEDESSFYRVFRGGALDINARDCRSASRNRGVPTFRSNFLGFRLLRKL
jgi:formylglycine-generating enzyme required for sulfatase activity